MKFASAIPTETIFVHTSTPFARSLKHIHGAADDHEYYGEGTAWTSERTRRVRVSSFALPHEGVELRAKQARQKRKEANLYQRRFVSDMEIGYHKETNYTYQELYLAIMHSLAPHTRYCLSFREFYLKDLIALRALDPAAVDAHFANYWPFGQHNQHWLYKAHFVSLGSASGGF